MTVRKNFLAATALCAFLAGPVAADVQLPAPYVSNALDAVILAVTDDVRTAFKLDAVDKGFLLLAVSPGGVADTAGFEPGDVIQLAKGSDIRNPRAFDEVVYYWITTGVFTVGYEIWREGTWVEYSWEYTEESYWAGIDIASVATWESWSYEGWSYSEYVTEYSEEISASYEESETVITEGVISESFAAEYQALTAEEASDDPAVADDASEALPADDGDLGIVDDGSGGDEGMPDDGDGDDMGSGDDGGVDEGTDDPVEGDTGGDDGGDDSGGGDE